MHAAEFGLGVTGLASLCAWLAVLLHPARPWDLRPIAEDELSPPVPASWPSVTVLVPARNEARYLPLTLPWLLAQDYPGEWRVVVVDDCSTDGTADVARALATTRATVVAGAPVPEGWVGKMWALEQAAEASSPAPAYHLLTDADIRHSRSSLRRLVAESASFGWALNSRMARLRCTSLAERLLIPPFLLFFNLLYPMRLVNDSASAVAAAAGGCVLVRRDALEAAGGFAAIRDRVIDDVSLAGAVQRAGGRIRLAVSRADVESMRKHDLGGLWRMVRRTAFVQLRRSWLLLGAALALMAVLFLVPPCLLLAAVALVAIGDGEAGRAPLLVALPAAVSWLTMAVVYVPTVRYFGLRTPWSLTLPLAGVLYAGMTLDSALRTLVRSDARW